MRNTQEQRFLVIGSGGSVGRRVCTEIVRQCGPESLVLGDYKLDRAQVQSRDFPGSTVQWVDIHNPASIRDAIDSALYAVIVCTLQQRPDVQRACLEQGVPCLDLTIGHELAAQILDLNKTACERGVPLLAMAGMWPGLSGLMAKRAVEMLDKTHSIDLGLCQSTRSNVGSTGITDMLGAFSRPVSYSESDVVRQVPGFSMERTFDYPAPLGAHTHRLVDFAEAPILVEALGTPDVRMWTGFDNALFDGLLNLLRRVGVCRLFEHKGLGLRLGRSVNAIKSLGPEGPEPTAIVVDALGEKNGRPTRSKISLRGPSDYGVTAMCIVAFARLTVSHREEMAGACHPMEHFSLSGVINLINHPDLVVREHVEAVME